MSFLPRPGGRDRPDRKRPMREVESVPCPDRDGNHSLTNRGAVTCCRSCGESWARLDAEVNGRDAS